VLLPPRHTFWENTHRAKRTFSRACWFRSWALMSWEIFFKQNLLAFGTILVLIRVLALFDKMFVHALDLNHLFALPAGSEHRTLFPIVDVDGLLVKIFIIHSTEITHFFVIMEFLLFVTVFNWLLLFLVTTFLRHVIFLYQIIFRRGFSCIFSAWRIDVCRDVYLRLLLFSLPFLYRVYLRNRTFHLF